MVGDDARRILDLGAGTGKLTRSLVALGHDVIAVEPSSEMIGQLRLALPGVEALEGAAERIPIPPGRVDVVTAGQAFHWFDAELALPEIARVLRPGGHLVFTTHGLQSCSYYGDRLMRSTRSLIETRSALYDRGFWFAPESGGIEEWGLEDPEWGMAFMTAEWVVEHLCPAWRAAEFAAGRNEENQDVYVLERG